MYTYNSNINASAVHMGLTNIGDGEKIVYIKIVKSPEYGYTSLIRNNISSSENLNRINGYVFLNENREEIGYDNTSSTTISGELKAYLPKGEDYITSAYITGQVFHNQDITIEFPPGGHNYYSIQSKNSTQIANWINIDDNIVPLKLDNDSILYMKVLDDNGNIIAKESFIRDASTKCVDYYYTRLQYFR